MTIHGKFKQLIHFHTANKRQPKELTQILPESLLIED